MRRPNRLTPLETTQSDQPMDIDEPAPDAPATEPVAATGQEPVSRASAAETPAEETPSMGWSMSHDPAPPRRSFRSAIAIALTSALIGGLAGAGTVAALDGDDEAAPSTAKAAVVARAANSSSIRDLLEKVEPAVVSIVVRGNSLDDTAAGTGMILTPDGEVLTNAHVVEGATTIAVTLSGESKSRRADVLGFDSDADVALLKIRDAKDLPTVTLGSSDKLQVGDSVVAIGNALALSGGLSVTQGIVSAKDRSLEDINVQLNNLIQTDAAINHGNSGGPLLNMDGEVIGVNTAGFGALEAQNISFAISIDTIKPMLGKLRSGDLIDREAWLGVSVTTLTPTLVDVLGVPVSSGAVIQNVVPGSPADDLGLTRGDVVVSLGGTAISSGAELAAEVGKHKPGDEINVTWYRGQVKSSKEIKLSQRPIGGSD